MWDLPVHGGLKGIGLDASELSVDTDNSSNSECQSVMVQYVGDGVDMGWSQYKGME